MTFSHYSQNSEAKQSNHYQQRKVSGSNYASVKHRRGVPPGREEDGVSPGLFTVHNSTLSHALFWVGGSKVKVSRNFGAETGKQVGGKRGKITRFSFGSRRRFMRKMAEVDRKVLPLFGTLTFPDEFHPWIDKPEEWKRILKRFISRFRRKYPEGAFFWRLELERRKSGLYVGEIFPHFHLLVYGVSYAEYLSWVSDAWWKSCGKLSEAHRRAGTQVKQVDNAKHLFSYVSKYMAKAGDYDLDIGRVWGVVQDENVPWVKAILCQLTEREAVQLMRYLRRYAHIKGRDYKSLTVLLDAEQWWLKLDILLYPP